MLLAAVRGDGGDPEPDAAQPEPEPAPPLEPPVLAAWSKSGAIDHRVHCAPWPTGSQGGRMTTPDATAAVSTALAPTGILRVAINLGNPVLAQGSADEPSGVTVDLAREVAGRPRVPIAFDCFQAARASFDALRSGRADLGFLAVEPARAAEVDFTAPYAVIEAVFVVAHDSPRSRQRRRE